MIQILLALLLAAPVSAARVSRSQSGTADCPTKAWRVLVIGGEIQPNSWCDEKGRRRHAWKLHKQRLENEREEYHKGRIEKEKAEKERNKQNRIRSNEKYRKRGLSNKERNSKYQKDRRELEEERKKALKDKQKREREEYHKERIRKEKCANVKRNTPNAPHDCRK